MPGYIARSICGNRLSATDAKAFTGVFGGGVGRGGGVWSVGLVIFVASGPIVTEDIERPTAVFNDDVIARLNEAAFGLLNREETESTDKPASWSVLKAFTVAAGITLHAEFSTEPKLSAEMATKSVILIPALS